MPTDVLSFQSLAQRIEQQEMALANLREEFETRKQQLADLTRRRDDLQAQLQEVESEIEAVQVSAQAPTPKAAPVAPKKAAAAKPAIKKRRGVSMAQFLTDCVREAKKPITSRELAEELIRVKYPTTSSNLRGMVDARIGELVNKGILRRAGDQSGVVLAHATAKQSAAKTASSNGRKKAVASAAPMTAEKKLSLKDVLYNLLAASSGPVTTEELVEKVLATGYQTKSQDFKNVIWVTIGNMPEVKRIQGKGYRLKKGKV